MNIQNFEQYERQKNALLAAYGLVIESGMLPVDLTGPEQVRERVEDLRASRFLVAVCGRIKAGKSTLLNALLFRDWVMPTDDMPHTAKNTLIEYGTVEALEVTFFNAGEWKALGLQLSRGPASTNDEFLGEVTEARERGATEDRWIQTEAIVERGFPLVDLFKFVTPVEKGGLYTPFVKQVKVIHPHPWLKLVTIADTPGVDDPYKFREDQTKQFVTRANAVLFVTYAGQAMAQPDFDFLNEYLMHVPPDRRLIAVNKVDTLQRGSADVESYLAGLAGSPEPAIKNVFGTRSSIHMVSALGALIAESEESGRPLKGQYGFYRDKMAKTGHLRAEYNGVDALRLKVEERLVTHHGRNILDGHQRFLTSLFERKERQLKTAVTLDLSRLDDLKQSHEGLAKQIRAIETEIGKMEAAVRAGSKNLGKDCNRALGILTKAFAKAHWTTVENTKSRLEELGHIDVFGEKAGWVFVTCFGKEKVALEEAIDECMATCERGFLEFTSELQLLWLGWESASVLADSLSLSLGEAQTILGKMHREIGSTARLDQISEESTGWIQRLFNTAGGRRRAASAVSVHIEAQLIAGLDTMCGEISSMLKAKIDEQSAHVGKHLKATQEGRLSDKEKLLEGRRDGALEHASLTASLAANRAELLQIEQISNRVKLRFAE